MLSQQCKRACSALLREEVHQIARTLLLEKREPFPEGAVGTAQSEAKVGSTFSDDLGSSLGCVAKVPKLVC
jgi:hypothetical protein